MDLLSPGEPRVNVQHLLECFDRPVGELKGSGGGRGGGEKKRRVINRNI